jgi:hypothetical protein
MMTSSQYTRRARGRFSRAGEINVRVATSLDAMSTAS